MALDTNKQYNMSELQGLGLNNAFEGQQVNVGGQNYITHNPGNGTRSFSLVSTPSSSSNSSGSFDANTFFSNIQAKQDALTAQQKADTEARFAQGKSDVNSFLDKYSGAVPSIYNDVNSKYNVPFWQTTATAIGNRINELQGNTNNAGAGGFANAGQVDKAISTNYLPRYAQATNTANTAAGLAQNEYDARIAPIKTEGQMLTDRLAREATGYSTEHQQELESLISQIQSGVTLGAAQMQRATQLAQLEQEKLLKEEELQYRPVAPGATLYDTKTGTNVGSSPITFSGDTGGSNPPTQDNNTGNFSDADIKALLGMNSTSLPFSTSGNVGIGVQ